MKRLCAHLEERAPNYHNANRTNISKMLANMCRRGRIKHCDCDRANSAVWTIATFGSVQIGLLFVQVPVTRHRGHLRPALLYPYKPLE